MLAGLGGRNSKSPHVERGCGVHDYFLASAVASVCQVSIVIIPSSAACWGPPSCRRLRAWCNRSKELCPLAAPGVLYVAESYGALATGVPGGCAHGHYRLLDLCSFLSVVVSLWQPPLPPPSCESSHHWHLIEPCLCRKAFAKKWILYCFSCQVWLQCGDT